MQESKPFSIGDIAITVAFCIVTLAVIAILGYNIIAIQYPPPL